MSEFLRSAVARFLSVLGGGVDTSRRVVRLPLSVYLATPGAKFDRTRSQSCSGYTRDMSAKGLSFVVPSMRLGDRHLFNEKDATLRLELELPAGRVRLEAVPVRYDLCGEPGAESGYLVGVHIKGMSDGDRALYSAFLRRSRRHSEGAISTDTVNAASALSRVG